MTNDNQIILALFPNARGFGYACMNVDEKKILDYGIFNARPLRNESQIRRFKALEKYHNPTVLLLRNPKGTSAQSKSRLTDFNTIIKDHTEPRKIQVYHYSRQQIQDVFEAFGATSKQAVAEQLIVWFEELADYSPRKRKYWTDEDYHMGVFDAMALIITHQYLTN